MVFICVSTKFGPLLIEIMIFHLAYYKGENLRKKIVFFMSEVKVISALANWYRGLMCFTHKNRTNRNKPAMVLYLIFLTYGDSNTKYERWCSTQIHQGIKPMRFPTSSHSVAHIENWRTATLIIIFQKLHAIYRLLQK